MTEKELRFQAIKVAHDLVLGRDYTQLPPRALEGIDLRIVKIADFMVAYVNGNHEETLAEQERKRAEYEARIAKVRADIAAQFPDNLEVSRKRHWWCR